MEKQIQANQDIYASGQYSKVADFFIGVGIYVGISLIAGAILLLTSNIPFLRIITLFNSALMILPIIISIILAEKYFQRRRLVKIGIIICFLLPIIFVVLLFGACLVAVGTGGLRGI